LPLMSYLIVCESCCAIRAKLERETRSHFMLIA
jgi:hypothetical protein